MANSAQATKRAAQNKKRQLRNSSQRSTMRTAIKKVHKLLGTNPTAAPQALRHALKLIDTLASHGIIHANTAARLKSRLNKKVKLTLLNSQSS